jgi:hypothetical protein
MKKGWCKFVGNNSAVLSILIICLVLVSSNCLARSLDNPVVNSKTDRPVLFVTDEMLEQARYLIAEKVEPFYSAWINTKDRADYGLKQRFMAYMGTDYMGYYLAALQSATHARDMALVYAITGEEKYAEKSKEILLAWTPHKAQDVAIGSGAENQGLVVARATTTFADVYSLIYDYLQPDDRAAIVNWFKFLAGIIVHTQRIWIDNNYFNQQMYNNHLSAHNMGLVAIGYVVGDETLVKYALDSPDNPRDFKEMLSGAIMMPGDIPHHREPKGLPAPAAGEVYDRYRSYTGKKDRGLQYAFLHLKLLTQIAEMAYNNGLDLYRYQGPKGERLDISWEYYADFYIEQDASLKGGFYKNDPITEDVVISRVHMYEIVHLRYPQNEKIREVLEKCERLVFDDELFCWSAVLTHGYGLQQ